MNEKTEIEEFAPWLVVVITLIGGLLRVFILGNKGMWLDETFSIWLANHSVVDMMHWIVQIDQHPPLYYLLLHYWVALNGDTPGSVRLLSALFGAGTIPIIYLIGKRMSGVVVGLAAAVFLALSPFNIYYAQDTRMYTLLDFNAAVAIYALVRLLTDSRSVMPIGSQFREYLHTWRTSKPDEPDPKGEFSYKDLIRNQPGWRAWIFRHRWSPIQTIETDLAWIAFIVFSTLTLLTHNTAVFFILATNIFVLGLILYQKIKRAGSHPSFQTPSFWNWVKAQIGIFLLWSPWIYPFIVQASRVYQEFWVPKPSWESVVQVFESLLNISLTYLNASQVTVLWILYALVLFFGLLFFRKKIAQFLFLATLFATPFLGELIVSIRRPIFLDRTLIWATIPLFLVLAAGIAQLRFRLLIIAMVGILGTSSLFSASDYFKFMQKEDWSGATREVAAFGENGDLVLFNATWVQIPFDYYFKSYNLRAIQIEEHGVPVDMFDAGILEPKMTESDIPKLISLIQGYDRVWLVYSHDSYTDPTGIIPRTLGSQMNIVRQTDYYGVKIRLYGNP